VFRDGTHTIIQTGPAWKTSLTAPPRWEFAGFDDSSWQFAKDLGAYGMQPWGNLSQGDPSVITSIPHPPLPARYLRHQFVANRQVSKATAYVCGLGFFELYVNGQPTTDHIMDPALSDYAKVNYYVTIDVTKFIKQGQNVLGVALGNGRFYYPRPVYNNTDTYNYGTPRLLMQVEITYADGSHQTIATDRSWKITDSGPIRLNNEYDGEVYDARMVMPGWTLPNYQLGSTKWEPADIMSAPGGDIRAQMMEPMRITKVVHPVKVTNPKPGTYIVDMGQTFYGTVRLHAAGKPGATVKMTSAYTLLPDGTLKTADNRTALTTDIYTFAGKGTETWNPIFKGSGYRRVQVTGFPGTPTVKNFDGLDEYTDVKPVGSFSCSNDLVNKIHNAMRTGMTMFLRSAPLDPDRDERQAWMGDPAKDSESEAYNFNVAAFYTKWMDDVKRAQRTDGSIPEVAMYWTFESGVEWPSVFTIIPDWYTGFYADNTLEANNYDAMKRWVVAMQRLHTLPDGTLEGAGYADWCDTYTIGGKISEYGMTPHEVVTTAYHYNNVRILQRAAKRLGRTQDEQMFKAMGDALYTAFMHKFYNPTTCSYTSGTQCSYVLPLAFGLLPADESQRKRIVDNLVNDIMVVHNGHLTVGLIGNQWLLQVLSEYGRSDVAWKLVTQTTRPSWGYMVGLGSDTIWERWDYDTRDPGMNSQALLIQAGNVDAWFYQTMGGINYDSKAPGFAHTIIHPYFPAGVSWVNCRFNSPHGLIVSNWTRKGSQAVMSVSIPANTTATVTTPDGVVREMKSGSWTLKSAVQ
jgi:alpha-L-rhamnosidase